MRTGKYARRLGKYERRLGKYERRLGKYARRLGKYARYFFVPRLGTFCGDYWAIHQAIGESMSVEQGWCRVCSKVYT